MKLDGAGPQPGTALATARHGGALLEQMRGRAIYMVAAILIAIKLAQLALEPSAAAQPLTYAAIAAFIGAATLYWRTGRRFLSAALLLAAAAAAPLHACFNDSGAPAPAMISLAILPLAATIMLSRRAGVAALLFVAAALAGLVAATNGGTLASSTRSPVELQTLFACATILVALAVAGLAIAYETIVRGSLAALETARADLARRSSDLAEKEKFLFTVMESVHDGIVAADRNGVLSVFNRRAREFHGLDARPLSSGDWQSAYDLFEADGETPLGEDRNPLARAVRGEFVRDAEIVIAPANLPARRILANASPLFDEAGASLGAVATIKDVTLERRQQAEIQRQNVELEQFARIAAHDLQSPLRQLIGYADLLDQGLDDNDDASREQLAAMRKSASNMQELVKDLLAFSRMQAGEIDLQPVAPHECVEAAAAAAGLCDMDGRMKVRVSPMPEVSADPLLLTQLYQNLLTNAAKFVAEGVAPEIQCTCEERDDEIVLGVMDNGIGVASEHRTKIFQPFKRLHRQEEYEGTGIGLAICQRAVEKLGGRIWIEDNPSGGAHFRFALKRHARVRAPASRASAFG